MGSGVEDVSPCDDTLHVSADGFSIETTSKSDKRDQALDMRCLGDGRPVHLFFSQKSKHLDFASDAK